MEDLIITEEVYDGNIVHDGNVIFEIGCTVHGNIESGGDLISEGNLDTMGYIYSKGNIISIGNLSSRVDIFSGGDIESKGEIISIGNIISRGNIYAVGDIDSGGDIDSVGHIISGGTIEFKGDIDSGENIYEFGELIEDREAWLEEKKTKVVGERMEKGKQRTDLLELLVNSDGRADPEEIAGVYSVSEIERAGLAIQAELDSDRGTLPATDMDVLTRATEVLKNVKPWRKPKRRDRKKAATKKLFNGGETMEKRAQEVDDIGQWLEEQGIDKELFSEYTEYVGDIETAMAQFDDAFQGIYENEKDYAYALVDDAYNLTNMMGDLVRYFDYEKFASDLFINDVLGFQTARGLAVFLR